MQSEKPAKPINWIDVLNDQTTWKTRQEFLAWFSQLTGRPPSLTEDSINEFESTLRFIREQLAALHFSKSINLNELNQRLRQITVQLADCSTESAKIRLPSFRAYAQSKNDADVLRSIGNSLLLQFAQAAGSAIDSDFENMPFSRCEGLYKRSLEDDIAAAAAYPGQTEQRWREEITLLKETSTQSDDLLRCSDFFVKTPKGRFCSDACRFTTFQIAKQLQDPNYLAEKQRRYRKKQSNS